jgi:hypothetical protein
MYDIFLKWPNIQRFFSDSFIAEEFVKHFELSNIVLKNVCFT